jgi:hypothetical protein
MAIQVLLPASQTWGASYWADRQDSAAVLAKLVEHVTAIAPESGVISFMPPEYRVVAVPDFRGVLPDSSRIAQLAQRNPWPETIVAPDGRSFAELSVLDSPDQLFLTSQRGNFAGFNYRSFSAGELLDAWWPDSGRFALVFTSLPGHGRPRALHVSVVDLSSRTEALWAVMYSGWLPTSSILRELIYARY